MHGKNWRNKTWRCADGRRLLITDMSTDHLRNAIAMMRRNGLITPDEAEAEWAGMGSPPQGEMASYYWEQALADLPFGNSKLAALEAELKRRS